MNFFRTIIILIIFALSLQNSYADNHDQKNIV